MLPAVADGTLRTSGCVENDGMTDRDRALKATWAALPWRVQRSIGRDLIKGRAVADLGLRDVAAWQAHRLAVRGTVMAIVYTALFVTGISVTMLHVVHRPHRALALRFVTVAVWIALLSGLWWSARRYRRAEKLNSVERRMPDARG